MPIKKSISNPILVTFSITQQCNLKCKHCYSKSSATPGLNELSTKEALQVIDQVKEAGTKLIIFDGGEPTLRSDLLRLIEHANNIGLIPLLGTNGTTLTRKMAKDMKNAGIRMCAVSLDGANAKTHDSFRCVNGCFDDAIRGIGYLKDEGIPFQVNPCIHRTNYRELSGLLDVARNLGARGMEAFEFVMTGRGSSGYELDTPIRKHVVDEMLGMTSSDMPVRMIGAPQFDVLLRRNGNYHRSSSCCGAGKTIACIFNDGTVFPCMLLPKSAGNVREQDFNDIWNNSEVFNELRDRSNLTGTCGNCLMRDECGGARCRAYAEGDIFRGDTECWIYQPG
ncbi:MAG: radical SAM protein [ANME-2 cluster archaeon]|nr:radical SAM protein [ANME-2 cluster archaeon]